MGQIIRDEDGCGMFMIPLFVDWRVRRCNITDCKEKPTTIITQVHPDIPAAGLCEDHYQEFRNEDGTLSFNTTMTLDDYDAFKEPQLEQVATK